MDNNATANETSMDHAHEEAIQRIERHLDSLRIEGGLPVRGLNRKLDRMLGMMPLFPNQFLYVVNYTSGEVIHARGFEQVLGYPDTNVDLPLIYNTWHPEDAPLLAAITERTGRALTTMRPPLRPFEVTLTLDYRVRRASGDHIKVQRQTTVFDVDERTHRTISTFSLCRDISDLKAGSRVGWHWEGRGAGKIHFPELQGRVEYRPSARELDVLRRMAQGHPSKMIAEQLAISLHTVNTHRRNLLERTGCGNSAELVRLAAEHHWI